MIIRKLVLFGIALSLLISNPVFAADGDVVREGKEVTYGINIGSGAYLDDANVTDTNIPAMQAAGVGFGDSPLWATDASTVTLKAATGQPAILALSADAAEDNSDKWRVSVADGGDVTLETYQSGAWVVAATWTNAGGYTVTGALAGATLNTGQGDYELYAMNQDVETTDAVTFATVDTGQGANELYDMDQNVLTTSSPVFVTTKLSDLTDTYIPYHVADATGLADSPLSRTGAAAVTMTGTLTSTVAMVTPAITAPAASLVIKPTTDAVTAVQVQDKDGDVILNVDTVNNRFGIGTNAPTKSLQVTPPSGGTDVAYFTTPDFVSTGTGSAFNIMFGAASGNTYTSLRALSTGATVWNNLVMQSGGGNVGIGTTVPDTRLHAEIDDATTNATTNVQTLTHTTSGAPAANIGAGLVFETETAAGNNEKVAVIEGIASELATPGAEDGALVFKTMTAGAAATEKMRVTEYALATQARTVKKTNVSDANYGTSALTSDYIIAFTSLSAARTATISTEDEDTGTTTQPRVMIFKDESGSAATYNITISLESGGTIDGAANFVIDQPYQSVTIYLNGTNGFIY